MDRAAQERFGRTFDPVLAQQIRDEIEAEAEDKITFPLSTIPVFLSPDLISRLCRQVKVFFELVRRPEFHARAAAWVPPHYRVGRDLQGIPRTCSFDFALTVDERGRISPRLIECQGISSLVGVVPFFGHRICQTMAPGWTPFLSHDSWADYRRDLERVLGDSLLIDIEPPTQRLRADFGILRRFAAIEIGDLSRETVAGLNGSQQRLFSRVVPIEAERRGRHPIYQALLRPPRRWVTNPDWYFMLSKRALADFGEVSDLVAETFPLTADSAARWRGRRDLVLKPNDDYGGRGVLLEPSARDVRRALASDLPHVLQERVEIAPMVQPPDGPELYCELRVLCLEDRPVSLFCRLARERLCNIDLNARHPWCGISVGLVPEGATIT